VVGGDDDHEGHHERVDGPTAHARRAVSHQPGERPADHQREGGRASRASPRYTFVSVFDRRALPCRRSRARSPPRLSAKPPPPGKKRGGAVRGTTMYPTRRDHHRDHEHVAYEVEVLVVLEVQVHQGPDRDRRLGVHVDRSSSRPPSRCWLLDAHVWIEGLDETGGMPRARVRSGRGRGLKPRWAFSLDDPRAPSR